MKYLSLVFATASVLFPAMVIAATVGFYAGTFDPPTQLEIGMLRCALGDAGVWKECGGIGKTIARLVVSVNQSHDEDTLASTRERALMVQKALQKYGDRVEVVTAPGTRDEKTRALLQDRNIEQLVQFIDSDSFQEVKSSPVSQDPRLLWMVSSLKKLGSPAPALDPKTLPSNVRLFVEIEQQPGSSASAVQKVIQSGGATTDLIDPAVKAVIEKLSLYQEVSEDLAKLQRSLFEESWKGFLTDLKSACPSALGQQACAGLAPSWETITIVNEDHPMDPKSSSANFLVYKRAQSEDRWAEKFTDAALKSLQGSAGYGKLKPVAVDMSSKMYLGYPEGKLFI
jgi:nicotinic acid mononucleotide adenylyltransferase